ncbi:tetratricopeptide repeat protein [Nonomuraea sp. NPDC003709]
MFCAMNALSVVKYKHGELQDARDLFERALQGWRRMPGEDHPDT